MTDATEHLPRGVWYEPKRGRYRVRLWRNHKMHLSYHATLEEALHAHALLFRITRMTPKIVRRHGTTTPPTTLSGLMAALKH